MIQVHLDPAQKHLDPDFERKLRECKLACKEAAGWRCEYFYPNRKRCSVYEGQLKHKKGRNGRPDGRSCICMDATQIRIASIPTQGSFASACGCAGLGELARNVT